MPSPLRKLRNLNVYPLIRPLLFQLDPEKAHHLSIRLLKAGLGPKINPDFSPVLRTMVCGVDFPNPIGLAAGYDKQCEVMDEILGFGFGFAEIGSVAPSPQSGNQKPRLFRAPSAKAIINRMGMPCDGMAICLQRLAAFRDAAVSRELAPIGINIGKNKDAVDSAADYVVGVTQFAPFADYMTINISSPNTPGMRDMQGREQLEDLLKQVMAARNADRKKSPVFVKIAPDLSEQQQDDIAEVVLSSGIQGMVVGNTTTSRPSNLPPAFAKETGGLSGKPLFSLSNQILASMYKRTAGKLPIMGCGGVFSAEDAYTKIRAGASLVQLYSALIYEGPSLVARMNRGLAELLKRDGFKSVSEAVGVDVR